MPEDFACFVPEREFVFGGRVVLPQSAERPEEGAQHQALLA